MLTNCSYDSQSLLMLLKKKWWFFILSFIMLTGSTVAVLRFSNKITYSSSSELFISTSGASYARYVFDNTTEMIKTDYFYNQLNSNYDSFSNLSISKPEYENSVSTKLGLNANYFTISSTSGDQDKAYTISKVCAQELIRLVETEEAKEDFPFLYSSSNVFGLSIKNYKTSVKKSTTLFHYIGAVVGMGACSFVFTVLIFNSKYGIITKEE